MMTRMMMFLFQYLQYVATYIIASAIKLSYVPYLSILLSILIIHPSITSILIFIIVSFIIYPHHPSLPSSSPTSPSHHQQYKASWEHLLSKYVACTLPQDLALITSRHLTHWWRWRWSSWWWWWQWRRGTIHSVMMSWCDHMYMIIVWERMMLMIVRSGNYVFYGLEEERDEDNT